eukprot:COSAG05_NODE_17172_length_330_cov_0.891775_1_plen_20_part_01
MVLGFRLHRSLAKTLKMGQM